MLALRANGGHPDRNIHRQGGQPRNGAGVCAPTCCGRISKIWPGCLHRVPVFMVFCCASRPWALDFRAVERIRMLSSVDGIPSLLVIAFVVVAFAALRRI